jgi:two-component system, sensor histidine kinase YesM
MRFRSLKAKIAGAGLALSLTSVILTAVACYFLDYRVVHEKYSRANDMVVNAAIDKTNAILDGIVQVFNRGLNSELYRAFVDSSSAGTFASAKASMDYREFLRDLILYNNDFDALIVLDARSDESVVAANTVSASYSPYRSVVHFRQFAENAKAGPRFFLDSYQERGTERIAIVNPILERGTGRIEAYMIAVLSERFSDTLRFVGDGISMTDGLGNSAWLTPHPDRGPGKDLRSYGLTIEGWKVSTSFSFEPLGARLVHALQIDLACGLAFAALAFALLSFVAKRIVAPIGEMRKRAVSMASDERPEGFPPFPRRRRNFKFSVLVLFSCVVAIPVLGITLHSYFETKYIAEKKISSVFRTSADLLYQRMNLVFRSYADTVNEIGIVDATVQHLLAARPEAASIEALRYEINRLLVTNHDYGRDIENIRFYDTSFRLLYSSYYAPAFISETAAREDLEFIKANWGRNLWKSHTGVSANAVFAKVGLQIRGASQGIESGKLLGYMIVDFRTDEILRMIDEFLRYSDVRVLLLDGEGSDVFLRNDTFIRSLGIGGLLGADAGGGEGVAFTRGRDRYLMTLQSFPQNGWKLVFILKNFDENAIVVYYSLALLVGLLALSLAFSFGLTTVITSGISGLLKTVRRVGRGDLDARYTGRATDEIGELGASFNMLLNRLNSLIEERYRSEMTIKDTEIRLKEYELNYLQAQINPHFLYNVLKTIQYMVFIGDQRAERMVKLLIVLFKMGIARGERVVSLEDELRHVSTYLEIQGIRFSNRFEVSIDVDAETRRLRILKLTLQPIVENAIQHGFEVSDKTGSIFIGGRVEGGTLLLTVRDTGVGMDRATLERIRADLHTTGDTAGIGLANVNARLTLYYGEGYGLMLDSVPGEGTVVTARIPVVLDPSSPGGVKISD